MIDSGIQTFPPALLLGSKIYITCHETLATMGVCTELTREVPREALSIFHFSFPHARARTRGGADAVETHFSHRNECHSTGTCSSSVCRSAIGKRATHCLVH